MDYTIVLDTESEPWCAGWRFPFAKLGPKKKSWQWWSGCRFAASRSSTRDHAGCDVKMPHQTPILAISDGIVVKIGEWFTGDRNKIPPDKFRSDSLWVYHDTYIIRRAVPSMRMGKDSNRSISTVSSMKLGSTKNIR